MFGFPIGNGNTGFNDFVEKFTNNADSGFPNIQQREVFYSVKDGNWNDLTIWQTASGRIGNFPTINDDVYVRHNITGNISANINSLFVSGIFTINASITINLNNKFIGAGNSQLINKGILNYLSQIGAEQSYSNGIYDITTFANTIGFTGNYDCKIPSFYNIFSSLTISGVGIKNITTNTTLNANLSISIGAIFECSSFDIIVNGTTGITELSTNLPTIFRKSGAGNILFVGNVSTGGGSFGAQNIFDFNGNPNIEFRGGTNINGSVSNSGTGQWSFTTNNQTFFTANFVTLNGVVSIVGNITIIATGFKRVNNSIDGTTASSTFDNRGTLYFINPSYLNPMTTGVFIYNVTSTSILGYEYNGNITIPFGTFQGLYINGTGIKSASQNIICNAQLQMVAGTLEMGIYDLTCNSTSGLSSAAILKKSGAGSLLFVGVMANGGATGGGFDFGGNPSVEFRSANTWNNTFFTGAGSGTGQFKFTATGQIFNSTAFGWDASVLVSGAITLTTNGNTTFRNTINGDNVLSTFTASANTITYNSATQPMATGVLDTSTNLNTWIYGLNNQNIKGGLTTLAKQVYRNLTLNGTGVKTLQGYVSVLNTYTLTAPATLALNGFTLTNP